MVVVNGEGYTQITINHISLVVYHNTHGEEYITNLVGSNMLCTERVLRGFMPSFYNGDIPTTSPTRYYGVCRSLILRVVLGDVTISPS